jgi:hypothetical protein
MVLDRLERFIVLAISAPSADNSQPWLFSAAPEFIECHFAARVANNESVGPIGHATVLAAGALHENLAQLTVDSEHPEGLAACVLKATGWSIRVPWHAISIVDPKTSSTAIDLRHTNRLPFKPLATGELMLPDSLNGCRVTVVRNPIHIAVLATALQRCSEGRFNDPELHEWLFSSIRWTEQEASAGMGLDIATLQLPPGGRLFMRWIAPWERMKLLNRFGIYRILALADTVLFRQASTIIAFSSGSSPSEIWEVGRVMQRTWIALNQVGMAGHPYYAVTHLGNRLRDGRLKQEWIRSVGAAQDSVRDVLRLEHDEQLHMLFRVGLPAKLPVRSRRLPVEAFLDNGVLSCWRKREENAST